MRRGQGRLKARGQGCWLGWQWSAKSGRNGPFEGVWPYLKSLGGRVALGGGHPPTFPDRMKGGRASGPEGGPAGREGGPLRGKQAVEMGQGLSAGLELFCMVPGGGRCGPSPW